MLLIYIYVLVLLTMFLKRGEGITTFVLSVVMGYFAGTVSVDHSNDTSAYLMFYHADPDTRIFETGYMEVSNFFSQAGYDYFYFRTLTYIVAYLIMWFGVRRIVKHPAIFYSMYFPFAFLNDATQVRNFWVLAIVIFAVSLVKNPKSFSFIIAATLIFGAAHFQNLGYLYLVPMILVFVPWNRKMIRVVAGLVSFIALVTIVLSVFEATSSVFEQVVRSLSYFSSRAEGAENLSRYAASVNGTKNVIRAIVESGTFLIAALYVVLKFSRPNEEYDGQWDIGNIQNKIMMLIVAVSIIGIPITFVSMAFDRIMRNGFIIVLLIVSKNYIGTEQTGLVVRKNASLIFGLAIMFAFANYFLTNLAELSLYMLKLIQ